MSPTSSWKYVFFAGLGLALLPLIIRSNYFLHILIMILLFGYLATCWNILGGFMGLHSVGHSLFVGCGAYVSTLLFMKLGLTPWLGMFAGGLLAAAFGLFIGYLCFRFGLKGPFFLLATFAFAEIAKVMVMNVQWLGGSSGLSVPLQGNAPYFFQFAEKKYYYYLILAMLGLVLWLSRFILQRKVGFYFRAIRENQDGAQAVGVYLMRYKLLAVCLSAFLSAIGGTFLAQYILFFDPSAILGVHFSIEIMIYPIVGGIGTILGPIAGSFLLVPVAEVLRSTLGGTFQGVYLVAYGLILVFAVRFMPGGIVGLFRPSSHTKRP
jgi:branched-chain amino acid transport system permease protein